MKSDYIGVYWSESSKKWYSKIKSNGKQFHLGVFDSEIEAAKAYDLKAYELRGNNTKFNLKSNYHVCSAPNCNDVAITKYRNYWVCQKHKAQLKQNGAFLKRTIYDKNEFIIKGEFVYISLYDKKCNEIAKTKIDKKNIDKVKDYKWYLRGDGYVATNNCRGRYVYLHNLICNNKDDCYIDHKDRNKLNNTETNLRCVTASQNQMNKCIMSNNKSGKVGVHWSKEHNSWCVMICKEGNHINLGYFSDYNDAVNCRINAEKSLFGDYRVYNEKERVVKDEI